MLFDLMLRKFNLKNQLLLSFIFQFAYDQSLYEFQGKKEYKVKAYIDSLVPHMQAYFCKSSLGTKIKIEKVSKNNPTTYILALSSIFFYLD